MTSEERKEKLKKLQENSRIIEEKKQELLKIYRSNVNQRSKELLDQYAQNVGEQNEESESKITNEVDTEKVISDFNQSIDEKEENQKQNLRDKLNNTVTRVIWVQLVFFNCIVLMIVSSVVLKDSRFNAISCDLAKLLFDFLKYYISATVVELLGMLAFILHYVFSKHRIIKK